MSYDTHTHFILFIHWHCRKGAHDLIHFFADSLGPHAFSLGKVIVQHSGEALHQLYTIDTGIEDYIRYGGKLLKPIITKYLMHVFTGIQKDMIRAIKRFNLFS